MSAAAASPAPVATTGGTAVPAVVASLPSTSTAASTTTAVTPIVSAGPGQPQALGTGAPGAGDAFGVMFALAVVIALIVALAWVLKRVQGMRGIGGNDLRVRAGISVGARERVVMVEARGKLFLVGVAPGSVRPLAELGEAPVVPVTETETTPGAPTSFAQVLRRMAGGSAQP